MRSVMSFVATATRILLGSIFLCVGIASALKFVRFDSPPNTSPAEVHAGLIVTLIGLMFGVLGWKLLTRRRLPRS
jgi:hypothetical protein